MAFVTSYYFYALVVFIVKQIIVPNVFPIFINLKSNGVLTCAISEIKNRASIIALFCRKVSNVILIVF